MTADDYRFMARALRLAELGRFTTHPNPRVGCVIVQGDRIVGEGWHRRAGEPHAEPLALRQAGNQARGATAYVTLEPCSHHGRTPPCADALIAAGVRRVVVAMQDPNPLVAGRGLERLRAAGIEVEHGLMAAEAETLNPGFLKLMRTGRPFVRCKLAMSLDGRTAMASGESQWITSDASRQDVQRLRAQSGAIVTGVGTVLADDPSLTVRLAPEAGNEVRQPLRVVLDSRLRTPPTAKLLTQPGETWILTGPAASTLNEQALREAGAQVVRLRVGPEGIDLIECLRLLGEQHVNEVLLETGPRLAGAALHAGVVDELVIYMAPHLMGNEARGLFHLPGIERMDQRLGLEILDLRRIGPDIRITAVPRGEAAY